MTARPTPDYRCDICGAWVGRNHEHFNMADDHPTLNWRWDKVFGRPATPENIAAVEREMKRTVRGY